MQLRAECEVLGGQGDSSKEMLANLLRRQRLRDIQWGGRDGICLLVIEAMLRSLHP